MGLLKSSAAKSGKFDRERKVLHGLVDLYIKTGKPIGSNTLKEELFADLSPATIRNYFAHLEEEGCLMQQHSSGGRIPTHKAFRLYAADCLDAPVAAPIDPELNSLSSADTREVARFLQHAAELLAEKTHSAVFLSAPQFDQDFILSIKLIDIDATRCLCALLTDFGEIRTEIVNTNKKLSSFSIKRLEAYFNWRLSGKNKPELGKEEEEFAQNLYNELIVRFIVKYARFGEEEVHRTGFSRLLAYPEYRDAELLANTLSFFENTHGMRLLLKECLKHNRLNFWIGSDLAGTDPEARADSAVIALPYCVNQHPVGAVGLLGPVRMPYRAFFEILKQFSEHVSAALTKNLYKFKISLKQPKQQMIDRQRQELKLIGKTEKLLLEDQTAQKKREPKSPARRKKT
jgi:heat-inducible transcriptional repressor